MKKRLIAKITVKPNESKNDDFTLALVDYFNKEFKNNNLNSKRNNSYVKVALSGKYMDKYDSVIVDCCNGKVYLRGDNVKDKYFGRLSKFNLKRKSDAYHCVNYNANRLIHRITKINNSFQQRELQAKVLDLRKPIVMDLRKNNISMSLDEEIARCKKMAKKQLDDFNGRTKSAKKYIQLANWLEELKAYQNNKCVAKKVTAAGLLTLDEAIEHCDEMADAQLNSLTGCDDWGERYLQYAHWLRELKKYKEEYPMLDMRDEPINKDFPLVYVYGSKKKDKILDLRKTADIDFDKQYTELLDSDDIKKHFANMPLDQLGVEYPSDVIDFLRKQNKISTDDEEKQWFNYLNKDSSAIKYRNAFSKIKNAQANDLATELDNNDDAIGRRIPTKNIDHINDFNRDKPFIYYEGKIYFGKDSNDTHRDLVNMITGDDSNKSRNRRSVQNQINDEKVGFGHVVGDIAFVDDDTFNCSQEEVAKALKNESNINKVYTNPYYGESYFVRLANKFHLVKDLRKVCIDLRNKVKNIVKNNIIDMRKNIIDVR